jgi:hypothetical protein
MFRITKRMLLLCVFWFSPQFVLADYGETFLYVGCNQESKTFEVEPFIVWNEELDKIKPTVERNSGLMDDGSHKLFRIRTMKTTIDVSCSLDNTIVRIVLPEYSNQLELYENGSLIISLAIGYIWDMGGFIYQVRFNPTAKWEEYCAYKEYCVDKKSCFETKWKILDLERTDTNCPDSEFGSDKPFDTLSHFDYTDSD